MNEITASVLLPLDGSSEGFGRDFLDMLRQTGTQVAPGKCGQSEPLRMKCSSLATDELVPKGWGNSFLWTAESVGMHGIMDVHKGKTLIFIYGRYSEDALSQVTAVFQDMTAKWSPEFGWIHVLTDAERQRYRSDYDRLIAPFNRGITEVDLSSGIPNLGWITILGRPYTSRIDRSALSKAVYSVRMPAGQVAGPVVVQLTREAGDLLKDFDSVDRLRQAAREAIGNDLFKGLGQDAQWVPQELRLSVPKSTLSDVDGLNCGKSSRT